MDEKSAWEYGKLSRGNMPQGETLQYSAPQTNIRAVQVMP
jgi:hypothetical protein